MIQHLNVVVSNAYVLYMEVSGKLESTLNLVPKSNYAFFLLKSNNLKVHQFVGLILYIINCQIFNAWNTTLSGHNTYICWSFTYMNLCCLYSWPYFKSYLYKTCTSKISCVVPRFENYNRFMPLYLCMKLYPKKLKTTLICNFLF